MKEIKVYYQGTTETCGIACVLIVLYYFRIEYPSRGKEMALYGIYGTKRYPGTLGAAVANALSKRHLAVSLVHSSEAMMDNSGGYYPDEMYADMMEQYRDHIDRAGQALTLINGADITCDMLRAELDRDRLVILQCIVDGDADGIHDRVLHGIVLYDYDGEVFHVCDPWKGKKSYPAAKIAEMMDTPVGKMYISAGRKA